MMEVWIAISSLFDGIWEWLKEPTPFLVATSLAKIAFVLGLILTFAAVLVWAERRQSAKIQDRVGPTLAGIPLPFTLTYPARAGKSIWQWKWVKTRHLRVFGLIHSLADSLKMIFKEDFVPPNADKFLHAAAPIIALVPALATFAVIPFGDTVYLDLLGQSLDPARFAGGQIPATFAVTLQVASLNVGILYIFGIAGTGVVGAAIAGYSSDNKFSLLGGMRAAGQMVSYEVTLGLALVPMFMLYHTLLLDQMVHEQTHTIWGFLPGWGIFKGAGIGLVSLLLFMTASIAESKRMPFDAPEGESEIVGGYFTEYSGLKFGMFFTGEFAELVVSSALMVTIFFGGYTLPGLEPDGIHVFGWHQPLAHWGVTLLEVLTFVVKLILLIWFSLMIRWTVPRFRYDQIMKLCWRLLLPVSLALILVAGFYVQLFQR